jgi:hypothetical protein
MGCQEATEDEREKEGVIARPSKNKLSSIGKEYYIIVAKNILISICFKD